MADLIADSADFAFSGPGIDIAGVEGLRAAYLMAAHGRAVDLSAQMQAAFGAALPTTPATADGGGATFIWAGPDQWLVTGGADLPERLTQAAAGLAAVSEQSDGRLIYRLSGPLARAVLARGCPLDLHPAAFHPGSAALSKIGLIGAHLWQVDDAPTYHIAILRSYAGSFQHWLVEAARSAIAMGR